MTALVWLRRELRLHDHPALEAALRSGLPVVPVFCFDDALLGGRHASGSRTRFLLECLTELEGDLLDRGSRLVLRRGRPDLELSQLARELGASELHLTADAAPFARRRQRQVAAAMAQNGVAVHAHPGLFAVDSLEPIRTSAGAPYTVFTPFHRRWSELPRRAPLAAPRGLGEAAPDVAPGRPPSLAELRLSPECPSAAAGGERAGRAALARFLSGPVERYASGRDLLAGEVVSKLSPYLHFGCLSAREVESRLPDGEGAAAFRRQLCWRDFYAHVLGHFPANASGEHQPRYRGTIEWRQDEAGLQAWCEGRTGHPAVDAAMRQLRQEGWMHNRARLIAGSFLTKDLGIDWRLGERWFMRLLLDGDESSNNGNWQWIASVGVDPQPPARRILNPARQLERFDPDGAYVRRHVPELEGVPAAHLAQPWTMPEQLQRRVGCLIGRDYPAPIVDHAQARREALARYSASGVPR